MNFTLGMAFALMASVQASSLQPTSIATITPMTAMPQSQTVEQYVRSYFADEPIMADIAGCESHFRQFVKDKNGNVVVLKNPDSTAVGVFQIMSSIHASAAQNLANTDINTLQGNVAYAQYLYEKEGTKPWNSSKACWSKSADYSDASSTPVASSDEVIVALK